MNETIVGKVGRPAGQFKGKYPRKPGGKNTITFTSWYGMIERCTKRKHRLWKYYGARGITVCERWLKSFDDFVDDMGERPIGTSIDRINNDGNYEPGNVRWATPRQQADNRRSTKGQVRNPNSLRQRAIRSGVPYRVVINRVYYLGWSEKQALECPKLRRGGQFGRHNHHKAKPKYGKAVTELLTAQNNPLT